MPVVDITMVRGRTPEQIREIADAAHAALVATYEIPVADRFQVIHQCEPYEFFFDELFGGGPRTEEFLLIRVTAGRPRPVDVKRLFFSALVENLQADAGVDPENVLILLDNVEMSDLSLGAGRPFDLHATHVPVEPAH